MGAVTHSRSSMKTIPILSRSAKLSLLFTWLLVSLPGSALWGQSAWNIPGNGNWNTAGNWSPTAVPNATNTDVAIVNGTSTVTMNLSPSVRDLVIASGNTLLFANGQDLFVNGIVTNNGVIYVNHTGSSGSTEFIAMTNISLSGTGMIRLSRRANSGNSRVNSNAGFSLTQQSGHTITGAGIMGASLVNFGLIQADVSLATTGNTLLLDGNSKTNHGLFQAAANSVLQFDTLTVDNTGGTIRALADSFVVFSGGVTVTGGSVESVGTGVVQTYDPANTVFQELTINGHISTASRGDIGLIGAINNTGLIELNPGNATSDTLLEILGSGATVTGGGTVSLVGNNAASVTGAGGTLTIVNQIFQGSGDFGRDSITINNTANGLILANTTGQPLTIDANAGGLTNTGSLLASNGGNLVINDTIVNNTGGTIRALADSILSFNSGATVIGGTVESVGTGVIQTFNSLNTVFQDLTINGHVFSASRGDIGLIGAVNNTGLIELNPGNATSDTLLEILGSGATVTGGGTISLIGTGSANEASLTGAGGTLTIVNQTFQGSGDFGRNAIAIDNQANGLIHANTTGRPLTIEANTGGFKNAGTLRASNGGSLIINESFTNNGWMDAQNLIDVNGSLVNGVSGRIGGAGELDGGAAVLINNGLIAPGNSGVGALYLDLAGLGLVDFNSTSVLEIELDGTSSYDVLTINGDASLDGTLRVKLLNGYQPASTNVFIFLHSGNDSITTLGVFSNFGNGQKVLVEGGAGTFTVTYSDNDFLSDVRLSNFTPIVRPSLTIEKSPSGQDALLYVKGGTNQTLTLEVNPDLSSANGWSELATLQTDANGDASHVDQQALTAVAPRFYRLAYNITP